MRLLSPDEDSCSRLSIESEASMEAPPLPAAAKLLQQSDTPGSGECPLLV